MLNSGRDKATTKANKGRSPKARKSAKGKNSKPAQKRLMGSVQLVYKVARFGRLARIKPAVQRATSGTVRNVRQAVSRTRQRLSASRTLYTRAQKRLSLRRITGKRPMLQLQLPSKWKLGRILQSNDRTPRVSDSRKDDLRAKESDRKFYIDGIIRKDSPLQGRGSEAE